MAIKLVVNNEKPLKKARRKRKPEKKWKSLHYRLPAQDKPLLVKYRYRFREHEGIGLLWDTAIATGEYNGGRFRFHDPILEQRIQEAPQCMVVTDWQYISMNRYEGWK